MQPKIAPGALKAGSGIAILAAEEAGVVHTDILADLAAAGFALSRVFHVWEQQAKFSLQQIVIDALSCRYCGRDPER